MRAHGSPRVLGLPVRPIKGHQIECNAPLSASSVRVDRSVAPNLESFDVNSVSAHEAARREQLRAFQADLLERLSRLEQAKREEERARLAQLAAAQDVEKGRARQLAAHASADLGKALKVAPNRTGGRQSAGKVSREQETGGAAAQPSTKLLGQAQQMLTAVLAARAGLRSRTAAARAEADASADAEHAGAEQGDGDEGAAGAKDTSNDGQDCFILPVSASEPVLGSSASPAAGARASKHGRRTNSGGSRADKVAEGARARARERLSTLASLISPSACSGAGAAAGGPALSKVASGAAGGAPPVWSVQAASGGSEGRSREALLIFEALRREGLNAERAYVQQLEQERRAKEARQRQAEQRSKELAAAREEEVRRAQLREHSATAAEAEAARQRAAKVAKAASRTRQLTQAARYSDALRASLKAKLEALKLSQPLPQLCACGLHPLDDHVALCAHNCELRGNPHGYALALSRLLVANGVGHLLDTHNKLLAGTSGASPQAQHKGSMFSPSGKASGMGGAAPAEFVRSPSGHTRSSCGCC